MPGRLCSSGKECQVGYVVVARRSAELEISNSSIYNIVICKRRYYYILYFLKKFDSINIPQFLFNSFLCNAKLLNNCLFVPLFPISYSHLLSENVN